MRLISQAMSSAYVSRDQGVSVPRSLVMFTFETLHAQQVTLLYFVSYTEK